MKNLHPYLQSRRAFTLVEVVVSTAVLILLLVLISQLMNGAAAVIGLGSKHIDVDAQARALLDRMAVDIASMVKRTDVDYYLKGRPSTNTQAGPSTQTGANDQMAFYSEVSGYNTSTPSPVSLVAYRLNSTTLQIERLGKGLVWNGTSSSTSTPMVYLPVPLASALPSPLPTPVPTPTPSSTPSPTPSTALVNPAWPQAADPTATDSDYEASGPQVFRFEYYYVLKGQVIASSSTTLPSILSATPWDTRSPINHTSINGLQDVAAIGVAIAVIDPKSRLLVSTSQLTALAGQLVDFDPVKMAAPGTLESTWQTAINTSTLPRLATSAILIYGRTFYLNAPTQ